MLREHFEVITDPCQPHKVKHSFRNKITEA
jgi:hypothetical protein